VSKYTGNFINYLVRLYEQDRRAMAIFRRSLAFAPGTWPQSYRYVEFITKDWHERDARRLALYAVAGLFASHPQQSEQSLASALRVVMLKRESASIEQRFISMLSADASNIVDYLRQVIRLLAADGVGLNYVGLLGDLQVWMNPQLSPDKLRQKWARDFYRTLSSSTVT